MSGRAPIVLLTVLIAATALAVLLPSTAASHGRYDNTWMKDFMMDAPWRVKDVDTAIPLTIILKDCDTDDIRELHWIQCWDVTSGETVLWAHDFDDEQLGDDAYEHNYWTYITTVTEGHPTLPDGTLLTPSNLGYSAGDAIQLKVSVYYKDDWFNYTETRYLRVHVAPEPYPWPDGWYGGDVHYHTMYTNNIAEYGAPLPAVAATGEAMGLSWLTATDHSCDLDETGDGSFSYATTHWEYTIQDETGSTTVYRDNTSFGSSWAALGDDILVHDSPQFRLYRGVEINLASIDGDSYNKTLHCLFYNDGYIHSPLSGALGERPVDLSLPAGLSQLAAGGGFGYAAHPMSDMGAEWGGIDWTVNGAAWGDEDFNYAVEQDAFKGLQAFNTRPTRHSSDQMNPWADFDAGVTPGGAYPSELLQGVAAWDALNAGNLDPLEKTFFAGGSDAHGDFNYAPYLSLDNYATDNAIGKVQTVAYVPGPYSRSFLPPVAEILTAYREGHTVVTDGPFVLLGVDVTGDEDIDDPDDLIPGEDGTWDANVPLPVVLSWASTTEFGEISEVKLVGIDGTGASTLSSFDPRGTGEGYGGAREVEIPATGFDGMRAFRVECSTGTTGDDYRAYANPVWVDFDATDVADGGGSWLSLAARTNPAVGSPVLAFELPGQGAARLSIYDVRGRLVRTLVDDELPGGPHEAAWNGRGDAGTDVASGVYFAELRHDGQTVTTKLVLIR